uniref:TTF-type domain-containing protein n=1 Tax=Seriola lalandi dorsalis TaxID=1841481 RepID=A0A3B4WFJ0_SERLL
TLNCVKLLHPWPLSLKTNSWNGPTQPFLRVYPWTVQADRKRAFNNSWFTHFTWSEYSQSHDSAYCFACRHFSLPNTPETPFTAQGGYSNWKKAMYKDGGFKWHEKSEGHVNAMFAWSEYKKNILTDSSIRDALDQAYIKKVEENRMYIKTIAEVLRLTAMQNIAQRGHIETEGSQNKGNFLIELIARHNPLIAKKMNASGNAKYLSNTIQNEIFECLSDMVRESIIQEVKESEVFSVIADETKDLKKSEQLSLVLRYYYNGAVHESFLDFQRASELGCLERYGLDYKSNLVGQGYDGAAVMSGRCNGVAARIKAEAKYAFYVHCNAHCLNLVIVDSVKAVPEVDCFFILLQKLYVYISGSYVHEKWLSVQRDMYKDAPRELQRLSDTRWACRYHACKNLMDRLLAVLRVLHEIDVENSGERSVEARGLLIQIDLTFIATLAVFRKILAGSCFDDLWQQTLETAKNCNVAVEAVEKRTQRGSSRLSEYLVESTVGQRRCKEGDKDKFRIAVFYPILDLLNEELQRRFSKNNCDIMRGIQALNPKGEIFLEERTVLRLACLFDCDVEDLKHELYQTKKVIQRKAQCGTELSSILDFTSFLEPYKEVFHQLFRLCRIAIALPVSSANCERSFSALKLIKNHFRTTMNDDRLGNIGVLSIERRRARSLNLDAFVERFTHQHQNRCIQLS